MPYKRIKRLILWIPPLAIALWEYMRHAFLLPYISMGLGNLLTPVLALLLTLTVMRRLFRMLEATSESLQRERSAKAALLERERLARELHDGISQSLFLLAVKLDKLEHAEDGEQVRETAEQIRKTAKHMYDDVRQSIASLRGEPTGEEMQWMDAVRQMAEQLGQGGLRTELDWRLPDTQLTDKEKVELLAIVREAMMNVEKHARASRLAVHAAAEPVDGGGFRVTVEDDGVGADERELNARGRYGVRMMRDRAAAMGWRFEIRPAGQEAAGTVVEVAKTDGR
ncbi:sensor histidine kinase [Paenibacillus humicola]|uniref:sensor histidine kinase n=1 Tax=Paenibacillus humicola TaxID=3110540 RepID=UPI00237AFD59|nr:histidine kinase [Paenibacillus humicola]